MLFEYFTGALLRLSPGSSPLFHSALVGEWMPSGGVGCGLWVWRLAAVFRLPAAVSGLALLLLCVPGASLLSPPVVALAFPEPSIPGLSSWWLFVSRLPCVLFFLALALSARVLFTPRRPHRGHPALDSSTAVGGPLAASMPKKCFGGFPWLASSSPIHASPLLPSGQSRSTGGLPKALHSRRCQSPWG